MNIEACYYLGYIAKVHGKQGELIVKLDVDFPEEYQNLESVFIRLNKKDTQLVPFFMNNSQLLTNQQLKIKIENVATITDAKPLVGKSLFLPLDTLPLLTGNQFYFHEVVNFDVIDHKKGNIGKITRVLDYPNQAVFEIHNAEGKEILIPVIDDIIQLVDRDKQTIEVITPEGLIDIYIE